MKELHTTYSRVLYAIAGLVTTATGLTGLFLDRQNSSGWHAAPAVIWTAIGVVTLVRSPRLGLAFDEQTLQVRNVMWTYSFDRTDASVFMRSESKGACVLKLRVAGRTYPVYGMTARPRAESKQAMRELLVVNGLMTPAA